MMTDDLHGQVAEKIRALYGITNALEEMFPGRHFTPDGHLVGSIGEVIAAERYNLTLLPASAATYDTVTSDGRYVQIKATQRKSVALYGCPDYLLVFHIETDGSLSEVYNGPGKAVWDACGKTAKNGQSPISLAKLRMLAADVSETDKIQEVR